MFFRSVAMTTAAASLLNTCGGGGGGEFDSGWIDVQVGGDVYGEMADDESQAYVDFGVEDGTEILGVGAPDDFGNQVYVQIDLDQANQELSLSDLRVITAYYDGVNYESREYGLVYVEACGGSDEVRVSLDEVTLTSEDGTTLSLNGEFAATAYASFDDC